MVRFIINYFQIVGQNNIWSLVASSHKHSPKAELDWTEIEGLFCQQVDNDIHCDT